MNAAAHVDAAVGRWEQYAHTNAFVHLDADAARAEAHLAPSGPLSGKLFSVKDLFAVADVPSCAGSLVLDGYRPDHDAAAVKLARKAGAVFLGKTNCAEFGFGIDTDTRLGGRVAHPTHPQLSPGGSSGGDAVAVAIGAVDFAIAGDYGGSIRWPAQAVGVYGLRPGIGRIDAAGRLGGLGATRVSPIGLSRAPWQLAGELEVVGVLARTPATIGQVMQALGSARVGGADPSARSRILMTHGGEVAPISDDVRTALNVVSERARQKHIGVDVAHGVFDGAVGTYNFLRGRLDDHRDIRRIVDGSEDLLCEDTRTVLADAPVDVVVDSAVHDARVAAMRLRARLRHALADYDALLMPVAPTAATGFAESVDVDGVAMRGHQLMAHLRAVSLTGLPALSVPVGTGRSGRPVSVQLVGREGSEVHLCALAARLVDTTGADPASAPEPVKQAIR